MREKYRAVFVRGGTSKALIFRLEDLPSEKSRWDEIFLSAMGSPDPYGRQLDGMGGGISSLSKVGIVGPSTHPDGDIDYTFAQVQVESSSVDYAGNCGNISSAIGPFAVDEGLVRVGNGQATVKIHNVNTGKIIVAAFEVANGKSVEEGDYSIRGVSGSGAPVRLDFLDPGGAATGKLLPSGHTSDEMVISSGQKFTVSMVDAANPCIFVDARDLGMKGTELPDFIEADRERLTSLEELRRRASVTMGISRSIEQAALNRLTPFVALIAPPQEYQTLSGETVQESDVDVLVRFLSSGRPHRAAPVTGALCTAIAMKLDESVIQRAARKRLETDPFRIGTPSGVLDTKASVVLEAQIGYRALTASTYRTTRRLFEGSVFA